MVPDVLISRTATLRACKASTSCAASCRLKSNSLRPRALLAPGSASV